MKAVQVVKRDGQVEQFSPEKIERVMRAAGMNEEQSKLLVASIVSWISALHIESITSLKIRDAVLDEMVALEQILNHFDREKYAVTVHTTTNTLSHTNILSHNEQIGHVTVRRYTSPHNIFIPRVPYASAHSVIMTNFTLMPHIWVLVQVAFKKVTRTKRFGFYIFPCGGFTPNWKSMPRLQRAIKKFIHIAIGAPLIAYTADSVIAISSWEKRELSKNHIPAHAITVIPLGVEDEAFKPIDTPVSSPIIELVKTHRPYVVQVSRIHPIKNIKTTIQALAQMNSLLSYIIVGAVEDENHLRELQDLINKLNLSNRVIFAGKLTTQEKYFVIDNSLCMVHMSYNESFGLSVYEGMSRGKICIAAHNSALEEAIKEEHNGYLFATTDSAGLASKLTELLSPNSSAVRRRIEQTNKGEMQRFTWANTANTLQKLIGMFIMVLPLSTIDWGYVAIAVTS
ncbi:glycosyltransferase [Candidatus Microgenomates bacterium]|nr:glycosyltransferase [Candidatus Microgenomates bacterium]